MKMRDVLVMMTIAATRASAIQMTIKFSSNSSFHYHVSLLYVPYNLLHILNSSLYLSLLQNLYSRFSLRFRAFKME